MRLREQPSLTVTRWDCLDHGEDEEGVCIYAYAYASYDLRTPRAVLRARRYRHEWGTVSLFSGAEIWRSVPYGDEDFQLAARYFADLEDVTTLQAFAGGYELVDPGRIEGGRSLP